MEGFRAQLMLSGRMRTNKLDLAEAVCKANVSRAVVSEWRERGKKVQAADDCDKGRRSWWITAAGRGSTLRLLGGSRLSARKNTPLLCPWRQVPSSPCLLRIRADAVVRCSFTEHNTDTCIYLMSWVFACTR